MLNTFQKALIRADMLETLVRLINDHSYKFLPVHVNEKGICPVDEDDVYRAQFLTDIQHALEKLL